MIHIVRAAARLVLLSIFPVIASTTAFGQPIVRSIIPGKGVPGAVVAIRGSGFNRSLANNIVSFGATRASVATATDTSLGVEIPEGATFMPVTVTNTATGRTGFSPRQFLPTFNNDADIPGILNYLPRLDIDAGTTPHSVAIADIDGDGRADIAISNAGGGTISVYRNMSTPGLLSITSFAPAVNFNTGTVPEALLLADIDGDGRPELIVCNRVANTISVFRNTSGVGYINAGSFNTKVDFAVGISPRGVVAADFDGDGKTDLAVANQVSSSVSVLRNTSTLGVIGVGTFAAGVAIPAGTAPMGIATADLDGDGKPDLALSNSTTGKIAVLRNRVTTGITIASFAPLVSFTAGSQPRGIAAADVDGDSKPELIVANSGSASLSVFRNIAVAGTIDVTSFAAKTDFATGASPLALALGDLDGDGRVDIGVTNNMDNSVSLLRNISITGTIDTFSLAPAAFFATGTLPFGMAVADLDGDHKPEIIAANSGFTTFSILQNEPLINPPAITSILPYQAIAGSTVIIRGERFNATAGNNIVYFGPVRATVLAATDSSITVTVPAGSGYMPVSVTNTANSLTGMSGYPFLPGFDRSRFVPGTMHLDTANRFAGDPDGASCIVMADIDRDGKPDMIVTNTGANTLSIYRNTSLLGTINPGSFGPGIQLPTGSRPRAAVVADVNGDGRVDIIVSNNGSNTISVFRNMAVTGFIGTSSFAPVEEFAAGNGPMGIAAGDLDNDGKPDVAVANNDSNTITILRNTTRPGALSTTSFAGAIAISAGSSPLAIAIADADGDSLLDIAVTCAGGTLSVIRNKSIPGSLVPGSFADTVVFAAGAYPASIAVADVDSNGQPDFITADEADNTISVFLSTATPGTINGASLAARIIVAAGPMPAALAAGDIDGDGRADISVACAADSSVYVFRNEGSGVFAAAVVYAVGGRVAAVAVNDIDGDGKPELIAASDSAGNIVIFRDAPLYPITGNAYVCVGITTALTDTTTGGYWTSSDTAVAKIDSATGVVTGEMAGIAIITYTVKGGMDTFMVNVNYLPDVSNFSIARVTAPCLGDGSIVTITSASLGDGDFTIMYNLTGANTIAGNEAPLPIRGGSGAFYIPFAFLPNTGNTVLQITGIKNISECSSAIPGDDTASFSVNPQPGPITGAAAVCLHATTRLASADTGGVWSSSNTAVAAIGSTSGIVTGAGVGMAVLTYRLPTGCSALFAQTINALPVRYTITGGGSYCAGTGGMPVGLAMSATGVRYRLYTAGAPVGSPVFGTGSAVSFGPHTAAGTYVVLATDTATACADTMAGTAGIGIYALPAVYTITGGGSYCPGGTGVLVRLSGSVSGSSYQLYRAAAPTGAVVRGTGATLSFGLQTVPGAYTVVATEPVNACSRTMAGVASVATYPLPRLYTVTGGGRYCAGGPGLPIAVAGTDAGINYALYNEAAPAGSIAGTGTSASFGLRTDTGNYIIVATDTATRCLDTMAGSAHIATDPLLTPMVTITSPTGDTVCAGAAAHFTALTTNGGAAPAYQWHINGIPVATAPDYTYTPLPGDIVAVKLTSNAICATPDTAADTVAIFVSPYITPAVAIAALPGNTICGGHDILFTTAVTAGGTAPAIRWAINGINTYTGDSMTYTPADGDIIFCTLTSAYPCLVDNSVFSNLVTVQVDSPVVPSIRIAISPGIIIGRGHIDTVMAVVTNGGENPSFQWVLNGAIVPGATSAAYISAAFANGDSISCEVTRGDACAYTANNGTVLIVTTVGIAAKGGGSELLLAPNPSRGTFGLSGRTGAAPGQNITINITDITGRTVYTTDLITPDGSINQTINTDYASGIYVLTVRWQGGSSVFRLVLQQ